MKGGGVPTVGPSLPVLPQTTLKLPAFLDVHFKERKKTTATILQGKDFFFSLEAETFTIHGIHMETGKMLPEGQLREIIVFI